MYKCTLTIVVFTVIDGKLFVFSDIRSNEIDVSSSLDINASTIFSSSTGFDTHDVYQEQLYTVIQDGRIVISYLLLLPSRQSNTKIDSLSPINVVLQTSEFKDILQYALQRLRWKIEYTNVVYSLLPEEFTLSELQKTYEAILGKQLDKRNFRKKILSLGILKTTGKKRKGSAARPAEVYAFKERKPVRVKVFT